MLIHMRKHKSKRSGFSLVELMAAVIILGILAGTIGIGVTRQIRNARIRSAGTQIGNFENVITAFELECSKLPSSLDELVTGPSNCPTFPEKGMLNKPEVPNDPWGNPYQYSKDSSNGLDFDLWSYGPDGEEGTVDDVKNWKDAEFEDE